MSEPPVLPEADAPPPDAPPAAAPPPVGDDARPLHPTPAPKRERLAWMVRALRQDDAARGPAAPAPEGGLSAPPSRPRDASQPDITYTATRVVRPSPAGLEDRRVVAALTHHELADTFRVLRTRILHRMDAHGFTTLAVTGPGRGDGKTLTALNLAVSLAGNRTRTVLLVDLDLRAPKLHGYLGIPREPGIGDYLTRDVPLADCLVHPAIDGLVVLPAGRAPGRASSDLLASARMIALAAELKQRYADRVVIYDLPPLLSADDALVFLRHVDCCLLTVAYGHTRKRDFQHCLDLLEGCAVVGTVLNQSPENADQRYEYYGAE